MDDLQIASHMTGAVTWESLFAILGILAAVVTGVNALIVRYFTDRSEDNDYWRKAIEKIEAEFWAEHKTLRSIIDTTREDMRRASVAFSLWYRDKLGQFPSSSQQVY
jgi:Na+-transporting methylmalonyl-CoA/oxaloacetate decarboxylase gamma subunit